MKKRIILITLLLMIPLVFLTGCLQLDIEAGIDGSYTSYLSYTVNLDLSGTDPQYHEVLINALNNFGWYYQQDLGFIVALNDDSVVHTLKMTKIIENNSFSEAFESLKTMLTDENMTAFMMVDMAQINYPRQDSYIISAMLDIPQIIRLSSTGELTPELLAEFESAVDNCSGSMKLTVPVSDVVSSSHNTNRRQNLAVMDVPLSFTEQTKFELRADITYSKNGEQLASHNMLMDNIGQTRIAVLTVCASLLALLLIILLISVLRYYARLRRYNQFFK